MFLSIGYTDNTKSTCDDDDDDDDELDTFALRYMFNPRDIYTFRKKRMLASLNKMTFSPNEATYVLTIQKSY